MRNEAEVTNTVPIPTQPTYRTRKPPGRRKARGAVEYNSPTGKICFILGYCDNCHHKVTATKEEIDQLKLSLSREKQKLGYRILKRLLERYEHKEEKE